MRKLVLLTLAGTALMLGACNTISGAGKDVASAGKAVTRTAEDAKK